MFELCCPSVACWAGGLDEDDGDRGFARVNASSLDI